MRALAGVVLVLAAGAAAAQETAQQMRGHFAEALEVHAAVIRGDLPAASAHARTLADRIARAPAGAPQGTLDALNAAAVNVRDATGVLSAAQATATMLAACGRCHRASGVRPEFPPVARDAAPGLTGQMREHKSAADQLLLGLVVPSDEAWRTGARVLATAPLRAPNLPLGPTLRAETAGTEERLQRLARDAVETTHPQARAGLYAQFLSGCADCHKRYAAFRKPR